MYLFLIPVLQLLSGAFYVKRYFNVKNIKFPTTPNNYNNPLNITKSALKLKGEKSSINDKRNFESLYDGIFGAMKIIIGYYNNDGLDTLHEIIKKYSGLSEGINLQNYINEIISKDKFITEYQKLSLIELKFWLPTIILRMIEFEQGNSFNGRWQDLSTESLVYNIIIDASNKIGYD